MYTTISHTRIAVVVINIRKGDKRYVHSVNSLLTTRVFFFFFFFHPLTQLKAEEERYKTEVLKLESRKLDISLAMEKRQTSPPAGTFAASCNSRLFLLFFFFFWVGLI